MRPIDADALMKAALAAKSKCATQGHQLGELALDIFTKAISDAPTLDMTEHAVWHYYTNDEKKARWKCTACGKVCRHNPHYKNFCSNCGRPMKMEA